MFWTLENFRKVLAGTWLAKPKGPPAHPIEGVSIDSRSIRPGQVFFALKGETHDGHAYLSQAAEAGASVLIIESGDAVPAGFAVNFPETAILRVGSTRRAMGQLALAYRRSFDSLRVIAVTGSNGKTTTVRLIDSVLGRRFRGRASIKSYNNDIGVPLTIFSARAGDQYLICEVGMNAPGEIAPLARMIEPDIVVLTSIGRAHLEAFEDQSGIVREKASLLSFIRPNGLAVVTADCPQLDPYLKPVPNVVLFGRSERADLRLTAAKHIGTPPSGLRFTINDRVTHEVALLGEHNALNAMAAVAVGRRLGLEEGEIAEGLASAAGPDMRFRRGLVGGIDLFNDAYNSSPESALAAVQTFANLTEGSDRRVVVLGDMRELGRHAESAHKELGDSLVEWFGPARAALDLLITVGPHAALAAEPVERLCPRTEVVRVSGTEPDDVERVLGMLQAGDAVLLKGSRSVGLDRIAEALARSEPATTD